MKWSGFRVQGHSIRVEGSIGIQGLGFRAGDFEKTGSNCAGSGVWGLGFKVHTQKAGRAQSLFQGPLSAPLISR